MKCTEILVLLALAASAGVAGYAASQLAGRMVVVGSEQQPVSLTATYALIVTGRAGAGSPKPVRQTEIVGIRSDGSTARILQTPGRYRSTPSLEVFETRTVYDLERAEMVQWYPALGAKTTFGLTPDAVAAQRSARTCAGESTTEKILGYDAVLTKFEELTPKGKRVVQRWFAPALGCLELRGRKQFYSESGELLGSNEREATSIVAGEPASSLFERPDSLVETPPSAVSRSLAQLKGAECAECLSGAAANADARYLGMKK